MNVRKNETVCEWQNVSAVKPEKGSKVGLAIKSLNGGIIHGLRHPIENGTNGWYIWCGEFSDAPDFFEPVCIKHLTNYLPEDVLEYLDLPSGFRFLIDGNNYEDVWFDEKLLSI